MLKIMKNHSLWKMLMTVRQSIICEICVTAAINWRNSENVMDYYLARFRSLTLKLQIFLARTPSQIIRNPSRLQLIIRSNHFYLLSDLWMNVKPHILRNCHSTATIPPVHKALFQLALYHDDARFLIPDLRQDSMFPWIYGDKFK